MVAVQVWQVWIFSELQWWSVIHFSTLLFLDGLSWCFIAWKLFKILCWCYCTCVLSCIWFLLANNIRISATIMQWISLKSKGFNIICKITHSPKWLKSLTSFSSNKSDLFAISLWNFALISNFEMNFTLLCFIVF